MDWSLQPNGATRHMSQEWLSFTGSTMDEVVGTVPTPVVHPDDLPIVAGLVEEAVESTAPFLLTFRLRRADYSYAWVMAGGAPALGPNDGKILGYLGKTEPMGDNVLPLRVQSVLKQPKLYTRSRSKIILLDVIADHISTAREIAKHTDDLILKKTLDFTLITIGDLLSKAIRRD